MRTDTVTYRCRKPGRVVRHWATISVSAHVTNETIVR